MTDVPSPVPNPALSRTVDDQGGGGAAQSPDVRPWLFVAYGVDRSRYIEIGESPRTMGRGPGADIVLQDERASKVHCSVRVTPQGTVEVADCGSRNGTFVDGSRVQKATLLPYSQLRIGQTILQVQHKDPAQVRQEEEAFRAAVTDSLTGIPNRRSFFERAAAAIATSNRREVPLAAVFIDIDHFKQINDTFGHATGDFVLKEAAHRINGMKRTEDLICRYGGEEFVLLLPFTTLDQAATFAERVRAGIAAEPFNHVGRIVPVTLSAGVATFAAGSTLEALLQRADQAMYRAKQQGRNRVEKQA
jgi:diguanylate cyclase (GGDEF)-like protein